MNSFVLIENKKFIQVNCGIKCFEIIKCPLPLMYGFIIVPKFIRDGIYDWIAKNRYRWFGKKEMYGSISGTRRGF